MRWLLLLVCLPGLIAASIIHISVLSNNTDLQGCGQSWFDACPTLTAGVRVGCQNQSAGGVLLQVALGQYVQNETLEITCPLQIQSVEGSQSTSIFFDSAVKTGIRWDIHDGSQNSSISGFTLAHDVTKDFSYPILSASGSYNQFVLSDLQWKNLTYGSLLNFATNSTTSLSIMNWVVDNCSIEDIPVVVGGVDEVQMEACLWSFVLPVNNFEGQFNSLFAIQARNSIVLQNSSWSNCEGRYQFGLLSAPRVNLSAVALSNIVDFSNGIIIYSDEIADIRIENFTCVESSINGAALQFAPPRPISQRSAWGNVTMLNVSFESNQCSSLLLGADDMIVTVRNMMMRNNVCVSCFKASKSSISIHDSIFDGQKATYVLFFQENTFWFDHTVANQTFLNDRGAVIALIDCKGIFSNCGLSHNAGSSGQVVYSLNGNVTIYQSEISFNVLADGNMIFHIRELLNISQSAIFENLAKDGAIYMSAGTLQLSNSTMSQNDAEVSGGAISLFNAHSIISSLKCTCNSAGTNGGAINVYGGTTHITGSSFNNNMATKGGAIKQQNGEITISATTFESNHATAFGGAIYASNGLSSLTSTNFTGNRARASAADVALAGSHTININDSLFVNSSSILGGSIWAADETILDVARSNWSSSYADIGGAIMVNATKGSFIDSVFRNCAAKLGGALSLFEVSRIAMSNSTIQDCNATLAGGAIFLENHSSVTLDATKIDSAGAKLGGAIYAVDSARVNMTQSLLSGSVAELAGGGLYVGNQARLVTKDSLLHDNSALRGGAVCICGQATLDISESLFLSNYANKGGGISAFGGGPSLRIHNSTLEDNIAVSEGAGVHLEGLSGCHLTESICVNNSAHQYGGCLYVSNSCFVVGANNTGQNNTATFGGAYYIGGKLNETGSNLVSNTAISGAAMYLADQASAQISGCTFESNVASVTGGAMFLNSNSSALSPLAINCTFTRNQAQRGGAVYTTITTEASYFDGCHWSANKATQFGAAIYLDQCNADAFPIASSSTFQNNVAVYGGCNMACSASPNSLISAAEFCNGCNFGDTVNNYSGYQTDIYQTATEPIGIRSTQTDPSQPIYLDAPTTVVILSLHDGFNTTVKGNYLEQHVYLIQADWPYGVSSDTNSWTLTASSSSVTPEITLCGNDQQFFDVSFNATSQGQSTFDTNLAVKLSGCSKKNHSPKPGVCATCRLNLQIMFLIFVLAVVVVVVTSAVCLGMIVVMRRVMKKRKLRSMQVPDLSREDYSLEDLLSDESIAKLKWSEIEFDDVILGKGASGLVRKAIWTAKGKSLPIATKELMLIEEHADNAEVVQEFCKEIKFMSSLHHPNVVEVIGIIVSPDHSNVYLASELMERGSVHDLLTKKGENIPLSLRFQIAMDSAEGMNFIHSKRVIHRDLKSHNLLINAEWQTKIADFGISTVNPTITRKMTCIGTPTYIAPEVLQKDAYSARADVYSFGILLCELFTNRQPYTEPPYGTMSMPVLTRHILESNARPNVDDLHPTLRNLIEECWAHDPYSRPSFTEIISRLTRLRRDLNSDIVPVNEL